MERRREVLRGCGASLLAGLAGCASGSESGGTGNEANGGDDSSDGAVPTFRFRRWRSVPTDWNREVELRAPDVVADAVCYLYSFPDSAIVALEAGSGDRLWRAEGVTLAGASVGEGGMYETETGELRCYR